MTVVFWPVVILAAIVLLILVYFCVAALVECLWPMRGNAVNGARRLLLRDVLTDGDPDGDR